MVSPSSTGFLIGEIERINRAALRTYFWALIGCVVIGCLLAVVGWRVASADQSKFVWQVAAGLILVLAGLPGNAIFQRSDRIATMNTYRKLLSVVSPESPEADRIASDIQTILARLGGS